MADGGNPKLAAMKSILLRAWRERWTDVQWSIHIKRCLPGSPDNAELAELLLQQALVGSSPNTLMLSYLKHAMSTQVVTYNAAIKEIVKYDDLSKMYCVKSLLDLIHWFAPYVSLQGNNEDSLALCKALLQLMHWLLDVMHRCLMKMKEGKTNGGELVVVMEKSSDIIQLLFTEKTRALLYVARLETRETFQEIEQLDANIRGMIAQMSTDCIKSQTKEIIDASLAPISSLPNLLDDSKGLLDVSFLPLNPSINILLIQEAVLNPTSDIQTLTEQILVIEKSQKLSRPELYCQLIRTCMLGLIEGSGGQDEIKLSAFTFLKLPQVLVKLIQNAPERDKLANLEAGLDKFLSYTPLLDLADTKCNCDCLTFLLGELKEKCSLLNDAQVKNFQTRRLAESQKSNFRLAETQRPRTGEQASNQQGAGLILRAEPTVQSILRTLDADYSKNQESLLGVLCHMLNGKSFELILAAAAATSRLQSFAIKLIKFNEFAKQTTGENGKAAHIRAMLFDITFLMLCHIMQLYGTEIISSSQEASASFFGQWASKCLPEDGKYKSLDLLAPADPHKVEALLGQLSGGDLKMNMTRWHEVCHNAPFAIHEVLIALEHGVINNDSLKSILENVKGKMCCLPVVVSAWMCSHINMLDDDVRKKPRSILQQLVKVSGKPRQTDPNTPNQYYNDRSHLMAIILHRMIHGVLQSTPQRPPNLYSQPANTPIYTLLMDTFRAVFVKGCIDLKSVHKFEHLLSVGGPKWFCEHLIREVLSHDRVEDLHKGVSLLYGLFHIDMDNLTLCLLHHTLPGLLQASGNKLQLLTDPRGQALAKLTVMCLVVVYRMKQMQKETPALRKGRKRTRTEVELEEPEESEEKPSKMRKLPAPDESLSLDAEGFNLGGEGNASNLLSSKEEPEMVMPYNTKDPINKSLVNLFRMANCVVSSKNVTQKTGFIMSLIKETINSGPDTARFILQFMPISMVSQLMKCLPSKFSPSILLTLCDVSMTKGRRLASKVIAQNARYQKIMEAESTQSGLDIKIEVESDTVPV